MAPSQIQITLGCGRVVGNTDRSDNLREDVLRVLDRLHLLWCVDNPSYGALFAAVSRVSPRKRVTEAGVLDQIGAGLFRVNVPAIAAAQATRFLNRKINKSVGLLESQKDADNDKIDIQLVQESLQELGLLSPQDAAVEMQSVEQAPGSGPVSSLLFPKTKEAIVQLKIQIVKGSWGWAPIRADEVSDDGDRYGLQMFLCDAFSVFLPLAVNAPRLRSDVHIFFSPAGVSGSRYREPTEDTFKDPANKRRTPNVAANEVLVHGLRAAFDAAGWVVSVGNSNSNILMVQAAQHWEWEHASHCPHGARDRRILLQR
jgi:hypothetical protein